MYTNITNVYIHYTCTQTLQMYTYIINVHIHDKCTHPWDPCDAKSVFNEKLPNFLLCSQPQTHTYSKHSGYLMWKCSQWIVRVNVLLTMFAEGSHKPNVSLKQNSAVFSFYSIFLKIDDQTWTLIVVNKIYKMNGKLVGNDDGVGSVYQPLRIKI